MTALITLSGSIVFTTFNKYFLLKIKKNNNN